MTRCARTAMRKLLIKFHVPILICLISFSVACAEFSELVTLCDDISNDCCVQIFSHHRSQASATSLHEVLLSARMQERAVYAETVVSPLFPFPDTGPHASNDLLHRLCIQLT